MSSSLHSLGFETYWLVMVATMLIGTYELSSILENLLVINPNLVFIKSLIKLTDKLRDKTVLIAEDKIDNLDDVLKKKEADVKSISLCKAYPHEAIKVGIDVC